MSEALARAQPARARFLAAPGIRASLALAEAGGADSSRGAFPRWAISIEAV
ncbi:hypothetical protein [Sinomonas terrae]|uniref:Uncharacterized protein n=1 Tax=Sinomonas terrae TaxID=2908838 RepID=A0ABS9U680_9MICC|nr:hypothetical protein [Sinomonas terrae]MCH6472190.1 hypothetical protein [Sinomonas terrae]